MDQCTIDLAQHARSVVFFSGRSPFFKGNYEQCLDNPVLRYALVEYGIGEIDTGAFMGVCVPRTCNDAEVAGGINKILGLVNSTFEVLSINSHVSDYHVDMDWLSYLTIVLLSIIGVMAIWGTARNLIFKKKEKHVILDAFDVSRNMSHFKIRQGQDLNIMDGIRALSMMWVVFGHQFSFSLAAGQVNMTTITSIVSRPFFLIVEAGLLSVDIFFMLGGFFLAFAFMREKAKGVSAFFMGVLQRVLRIWPAYILAMCFYYSIFMHTGSGMFWSKAQPDVSMCRSMWREVFFVANMIDRGKEMCLGWGWYLQVDFQLFILSLLLLFLYQRSKKACIITTLVCMTASTIFNITFTYNHEVRIFTDLGAFVNFEDFMLDLYEKPWGRCTPYFFGLLLGIFYMEYRIKNQLEGKKNNLLLFDKLNNSFQNKRVRICVEWVGIILMSFVAFIPRCQQTGDCVWPQLTHSFYWGLSKPIFLLGLTMTILPSMLGCRHSFFNTILTSKAFHFIARISFCTYLVHLMIIYHYTLSRNYNIYYNIKNNFIVYLGILVISLFFGFIVTILVELPFAKLQKQVMAIIKSKAKSKKDELGSLITENQGKNSLVLHEKIDKSTANAFTHE